MFLCLCVGKDEYLHSRDTKNKIVAAIFFVLNREFYYFIIILLFYFNHCNRTTAHQGHLSPPLVAGIWNTCQCFVFAFFVASLLWLLCGSSSNWTFVGYKMEKKWLFTLILDYLSQKAPVLLVHSPTFCMWSQTVSSYVDSGHIYSRLDRKEQWAKSYGCGHNYSAPPTIAIIKLYGRDLEMFSRYFPNWECLLECEHPSGLTGQS